MFMPEGKCGYSPLNLRFFIERPDKKCLIQSHCHEPLFHIEALLILKVCTSPC